MSDNGWDEYKRLVLHEIEDMNATLRALQEDQKHIREDLAGLKAIAGFVGGLAGAAASLIGRLF